MSLTVEVLSGPADSQAIRPGGGGSAESGITAAVLKRAYVHWIRRFILFHAGAHPRELGEGHVNTFLTHLAVNGNLGRIHSEPALALLFLYGHVLEQPLNRIEGVVRARKPKRLPVVLTSDEVEAVLAHLDGVPSLVCTLLYGTVLC